MIDIAKKYAESGLYCLPVKLDKSPSIAKWRNGEVKLSDFKSAIGIGVMCGKESGNLECFDFDNKFGDAKHIVSEFLNIEDVKAIYEKYKLPVSSTQSGGYHMLFRCEHNDGNQKLASRPDAKEKPVALIETRGTGGYFVAPPTKGYKEIRNSIEDIKIITKEDRDVLICAAKSFNEFVQPERIHSKPIDGEKVGDKYNDDYAAISEMEGALIRAGWSKIDKYKWCRPDKKDGVSATVGKVAANVFYCFTSSGHPFEENSGYKPFQVVGLLDYGGDFKALAKELGERYNPKKPDYTKKPEEREETNNLNDLMIESFIDLNVPPVKPPVIMNIINNAGKNLRLFTLGNFSAITGRAKSKKSFLSSLILAAASNNSMIQNKIIGNLPESKNMVIRFDTEQSRYDAYVASKTTERLVGIELPNFYTFDLRKYDPQQRCDIIGYILEKFKNSIGMAIVDGVADMARAINDEEEATRVTSLLMKWTEIYNIHMVVVIHQNKTNNFATGHLGSSIMKKAEAVISVEKDEQDYNISRVKCDMIRGTEDFDDFDFEIDSNGIPNILQGYTPIIPKEEVPF